MYKILSLWSGTNLRYRSWQGLSLYKALLFLAGGQGDNKKDFKKGIRKDVQMIKINYIRFSHHIRIRKISFNGSKVCDYGVSVKNGYNYYRWYDFFDNFYFPCKLISAREYHNFSND